MLFLRLISTCCCDERVLSTDWHMDIAEQCAFNQRHSERVRQATHTITRSCRRAYTLKRAYTHTHTLKHRAATQRKAYALLSRWLTERREKVAAPQQPQQHIAFLPFTVRALIHSRTRSDAHIFCARNQRRWMNRQYIHISAWKMHNQNERSSHK